MKLHEFIEKVQREREIVHLTNLEKISKIVTTTEKEKNKND